MLVTALAAASVLVPAAPTSVSTPARTATEPATATPDATEPAGAELPRRRVIMGIAEGDPQVRPEQLALVLDGHFADTGIHPRVAALAGTAELGTRLAWASTYAREPDVLAVFWIEGTGRDRRLYMFEPAEQATWTRELPPSSDPDEMLESLGTMLRGLSLWMEAGPPPGMDAAAEPSPPATTRPVPPARPARDASPPPTRRPVWSLAATYAGASLSDQAYWRSGGALTIDLELPSHVVGSLGVAGLSPVVLREPPRTTVWRVPIGVAVGYRFRAGAALRPQLDVALVVEPTWWRARGSAGVQARSGATARVAIAPGLGLRWRLRGGFGLVLHGRADLRIVDAELVVLDAGRRVPRLQPHRVAALGEAGVFFAF
ncbi:MAG: hypothetical protein AB1Z98_36635 [Nannocystaceae bacterium]